MASGSTATHRRGLAYAWAAYALWGFCTLYWPLLLPASAAEVLAHRIMWSLVLVVAILAVVRRLGDVRVVLRDRSTVLALGIAAVVIAANWGTYIWAVTHGHVLETSLGYYINPLVLILLGVLVLGERLRRLQWVAVGFGAAAVAVLTWDYGRPPWIALVLACSFGVYGLTKKRARAGAVEGLTIETGVLVVPAVLYVGWLGASSSLVLVDTDWWRVLLLVGAGVVTAAPLLLFAAAASRVPLSTLGLVQYVAPTIQLVLGVVVFREPMPPGRLAGFALVWVALAVLTYDSLRASHRARVAAADERDAAAAHA